MDVPKRRCSRTMEGNTYDQFDHRIFRRQHRNLCLAGARRSEQAHRQSIAIIGLHPETELTRPITDPHNLVMLAASPKQDGIPPRFFRRCAGIAGLQRFDRIDGLRARLDISGRREGSMCLYPAGARWHNRAKHAGDQDLLKLRGHRSIPFPVSQP